MPERVIYVVRSWPRLSQTFIINEVRALERAGADLAIFSMVRSGETLVQPEVRQVRSPVEYLSDRSDRNALVRVVPFVVLLLTSPRRLVRALLLSLRRPELAAGYGECSTLECFVQAVEIAARVRRMRRSGDRVEHLHAHFAHDPALVGMLAARLADLRFSFTAHARDLLQIPASSLAARAGDAVSVVTCCEANASYITSALPRAHRPPIEVIHHGIELNRFAPGTGTSGESASGQLDVAARVPTITSIGRLVAKKGYPDLLRALALLADRGVPHRCEIYGDGPLLDQLAQLSDDLGLRGRVELKGAVDSSRVIAVLRATDLFALTPRVTDDGDRDGIPNVLVEAMACGVSVLTASTGGIRELVRDGDNGVLVPAGDVTGIADGLTRLLGDAELRRRLGAAGRRTVEADYDIDAAARRLLAIYRLRPALALEVAR